MNRINEFKAQSAKIFKQHFFENFIKELEQQGLQNCKTLHVDHTVHLRGSVVEFEYKHLKWYLEIDIKNGDEVMYAAFDYEKEDVPVQGMNIFTDNFAEIDRLINAIDNKIMIYRAVLEPIQAKNKQKSQNPEFNDLGFFENKVQKFKDFSA